MVVKKNNKLKTFGIILAFILIFGFMFYFANMGDTGEYIALSQAREIVETGKLDSNVNYYFSKISYTKDERWFYLFCPTVSEATIVFNNNEKLVYIDYYYTDKTLASFLWFFTNPELFYKHTVDFNDILSALQVQSEVILWNL